MATLTRAAILAAEPKLATETVEVPEWGGSVIVREMSGRDRDAYEVSLLAEPGRSTAPNLANVRAKLIAFSCVDEEGERLFTDADVELLGEKSAAALQRVFDVAMRLSRIGPDAVETMVKAVGKGRSAASGSGSPLPSAGR